MFQNFAGVIMSRFRLECDCKSLKRPGLDLKFLIERG